MSNAFACDIVGASFSLSTAKTRRGVTQRFHEALRQASGDVRVVFQLTTTGRVWGLMIHTCSRYDRTGDGRWWRVDFLRGLQAARGPKPRHMKRQPLTAYVRAVDLRHRQDLVASTRGVLREVLDDVVQSIC